MICRRCGELLRDSARVCHICGASQTGAGTTVNPAHRESDDCAHDRSEARRPTYKSAKPSKSKSSTKKGKSGLGWVIPVVVVIVAILEEVGVEADWNIGVVVLVAIVAAVTTLVRAIVRAVREAARHHRYAKKERDYYDLQKMR